MKVYARVPINIHQIVVPKGQIYVIPERCKGCQLCIRFCPNNVLYESGTLNAKGYHLPEIIDGKEDDCVHCEFCSLVCPEFAIFTQEVVQ